jgi:hypothetical protein
MLQTDQANEASSRTLFFEWFKKSEGEVRTSKTVPEVRSRQLFEIPERSQKQVNCRLIYRRMTLKLVKDQRNTIGQTIRQIDHKDLGKMNICTKCVPYSLMAEQKEHELTTCEDFNQTCKTNPHFLSCILIGKDFQIFHNDSETKRHGVQEPGVCLQNQRYRPTMKMRGAASSKTFTSLSQTTLRQIM